MEAQMSMESKEYRDDPLQQADLPLSEPIAKIADQETEAVDLLRCHKPAKAPGLLNPVVLAYIGDAVFEVLVRQYLISQPNHKPYHLHREATRFVSAKAQRGLLEKWAPILTEEEADIMRRGRNTKSGTPPKNADPADYRLATALECLVGYLYYTKQIMREFSVLKSHRVDIC